MLHVRGCQYLADGNGQNNTKIAASVLTKVLIILICELIPGFSTSETASRILDSTSGFRLQKIKVKLPWFLHPAQFNIQQLVLPILQPLLSHDVV